MSLQLCVYGFIMNDDDGFNCRHVVELDAAADADVCQQVFRHVHSFLFKHFVELAIVLASTNSFINPLIYLQCSIEFRNIVKKFAKNLKRKITF